MLDLFKLILSDSLEKVDNCANIFDKDTITWSEMEGKELWEEQVDCLLVSKQAILHGSAEEISESENFSLARVVVQVGQLGFEVVFTNSD